MFLRPALPPVIALLLAVNLPTGGPAGLRRSDGPMVRRVPDEYKSIQAAIDRSSDGDTVVISEGDYYESIRYRGKAITVGSDYVIDGDTSHIANTVLHPGGSPDSGSVVYFISGEDTTSVLCGVTIEGGTGTSHHYFFSEPGMLYRMGGGIFCNGAGPKILRNIITGNRCDGMASSGGGIVAITESPSTYMVIEENSILDNHITGSLESTGWETKGGGASIRVSARIARNRFERNTASARSNARGGGLIFARMHPAVPDGHGPYPGGIIAENLFRWNGVRGWGGTGGEGGGIAIQSAGETVIKRNMIVSNTTVGGGGGIEIGTGDVEPHYPRILENNVITDNTSQNSMGGGVAIYEPTGLFMNNTIAGNHGGGIQLWCSCDFRFVNNIIWGNAPFQVGFYTGTISGRFYYNDVAGEFPGEGNIDVNPQFADTLGRLGDSSACIGGGIDSLEVEGVRYAAPSVDWAGCSRPAPAGSYPDIGARENPLAIGANVFLLRVIPEECDFLNVPPGGVSDTSILVIQNRTPTAGKVQSLSLGRGEFRFAPMPSLPFDIPPRAKVPIRMVFCPAVPGVVVRDTLVIHTADTALSRVTVPLRGRGSGAIRCAQPGVLYGIAPSGASVQLYTIGVSSGKATPADLFSPRPPASFCALAVRRSDSTIYAAFTSADRTKFLKLSSEHGDLELFKDLPVGNVSVMAFSPADQLYVVAGGTLYRIGVADSDAVVVGMMGHDFTGLAFGPANGVLWGSIRDSIYTVDPATGAVGFVGSGGEDTPRSTITFNPLGTMYALYGSTLFMIGKARGDANEIGVTGVPGLLAVAMRSDVVTGVDQGELAGPLAWNLEQNYPNPFNPATVIRYTIGGTEGYRASGSLESGPAGFDVRLAVYDLLGREVTVLVDERKGPGTYSVRFDASGLSSGVYFYRLTAGKAASGPAPGTGSFSRTRKFLFIR